MKLAIIFYVNKGLQIKLLVPTIILSFFVMFDLVQLIRLLVQRDIGFLSQIGDWAPICVKRWGLWTSCEKPYVIFQLLVDISSIAAIIIYYPTVAYGYVRERFLSDETEDAVKYYAYLIVIYLATFVILKYSTTIVTGAYSILN